MPWMTTLWNDATLVPAFQNRSLSQITIPGTHDAGCYIDRGWVGNMFSRTQTQTIAQQLAGGIRYFDLRPREWNGEIWTYHGAYYGDRMDGVGGIIDQVAVFMNGLGVGDRELVILNISHFAGFGNAEHLALIAEIIARLGAHLLPHPQSGANSLDLFQDTLVNLLTSPAGVIASRVVVLYDGALDQPIETFITDVFAATVAVPTAVGATLPAGFFVLSPKYAPVANPIQLFDWYADAQDVDTLRTNQLAKLRNRTNYRYDNLANGGARWPGGNANWATANAVGGVASTLHLFSWTQTPQKRTNPFATRDPVAVAANETNPMLLDLFNNLVRGWAGVNYDPAADLKINILYIDNYASLMHTVVGSPWAGLALPVAIAARLNVGALTW